MIFFPRRFLDSAPPRIAALSDSVPQEVKYISSSDTLRTLARDLLASLTYFSAATPREWRDEGFPKSSPNTFIIIFNVRSYGLVVELLSR
jgi:hypothetical protein